MRNPNPLPASFPARRDGFFKTLKTAMQNNSEGPAYLFVSTLSTLLAWITIQEVQVIMTLAATCVSVLSGLLAFIVYLRKLKSK